MRLAIPLLLLFASISYSADPEPKEIVAKAVKAVGGEDKLLKLFRIKEKLILGSDPNAKGSNRISTLEPPTYWWMGKKERVKDEKEPAIFLVWAWTLGAVTDPKSKLESTPEIKDEEKALVGVKVSGTIDPAMTVYFDKETNLLARIDWRSDIHRFSDWKEADGVKYAAKTIGYKKATGKPWYFTEILEVERLKELPKDLKR